MSDSTLHKWSLDQLDLGAVHRFAGQLSFVLRAGDCVCLRGDLGAGKTTLARALILDLLGPGHAEDVPSPTFSLQNSYEAPRFEILHYDFYRIGDSAEIIELGFEDGLADAVSLVEWPEKGVEFLPADRLDIALDIIAGSELRQIEMTGRGDWAARLARFEALVHFVSGLGTPAQPSWDKAQWSFMQGDASNRAYGRLSLSSQSLSPEAGAAEKAMSKAVLMDSPAAPDGPPDYQGRSYSDVVHLAEDVRPFITVRDALEEAGLRVPALYGADDENGFLVLEDLGQSTFAHALGAGADEEELYKAAVDVLVALRAATPSPELSLACLDEDAFLTEASLLADWFWPEHKGAPMSTQEKDAYFDIWRDLYIKHIALPGEPEEPEGPESSEGPEKLNQREGNIPQWGWLLRDYHSPNLFWLPQERGIARIGVIDFQDALYGPLAYDLVSLLQDARRDISADLENNLFAHYCAKCFAQDPHFRSADFAAAYAVLGAQRNSKILGIFTRLARRDGKTGYLSHRPRIWDYLQRSLDHPACADLQKWFAQHFHTPFHNKA